ncbi:MAG: hypothetical protein ACPHDT_06115, partial [Acidimicrobiales bacterium]
MSVVIGGVFTVLFAIAAVQAVLVQTQARIDGQKAENLANLPEDYYRRGLQGKSDDWIKVNLGNEYGFVSAGKPVHPLYTDSIHCLPDLYVPSTDQPIVL